MKINNNPFSDNQLVTLKDQDWLDKQRVAGKIASAAINKLEQFIKDKTTHAMVELNSIVEEFIEAEGGTPTFKNYQKKGGPDFPAGVCISINKELVHGVPKNIQLNEGDLVSFDLGVTYQKAIADTAATFIFGKPKNQKHVDLVKDTEEALMRGIRSIKIGNRIGCIGNAIYKYAKGKSYSVCFTYGGHGLDWEKAHSSPFISNKAELNEGIRIEPGMVIAIEPLLILGSSNITKTLQDHWTVEAMDICAHAEHSIYIHNDHIEIITHRENSNYPREIMF